MKGVGAAAESVGAKVLGGDLVNSDKYLVDVCVFGAAERPVTRAGARAGDGIWVTGHLGGAGLALGMLQRGEKLAADLRARYAHPIPRIAAGQWLADRDAGAMIDVSDGLAADLGHIAAASHVAVGVMLEKVPVWPGVAPLDALASGEEFELAVVLPPAFDEDDATAFMRDCGVPLTLIGACAPGAGVTVLDRGRAVPTPAGFDHFGPR
jgi:thiamine-monophosphate kinase